MKSLKEKKVEEFNKEFGIHFKNNKDELKFADTFLEELIDTTINEVEKKLRDINTSITLIDHPAAGYDQRVGEEQQLIKELKNERN